MPPLIKFTILSQRQLLILSPIKHSSTSRVLIPVRRYKFTHFKVLGDNKNLKV